MATSSGSAGYHARFLRSLVAKDLADKAREAKRRAQKARDGDSVSGSSANAPSPSLLHSPTNLIPSYHPPAIPPGLQQFASVDQHNGAMTTSPNTGDTPNPFVIPPGQNPYATTVSNGPAMVPDTPMSRTSGHDMQFTNALTTPMQLSEQQFQFSYSRPQHPPHNGNTGLANALDFQQYAPNSPWDPSNSSLEAFGPPDSQLLNGVSDADINYWRHMFVSLGFNSG